jgi:hypothetical protein
MNSRICLGELRHLNEVFTPNHYNLLIATVMQYSSVCFKYWRVDSPEDGGVPPKKCSTKQKFLLFILIF